MVFHFFKTIIGKLVGSTEPISCNVPIVMPDSIYVPKLQVLHPACVDTQILLNCQVVRKDGHPDMFIPMPGKITLIDSCLSSNEKDLIVKYPTIIDRVDLVMCHNQIPFQMPFDLKLQYFRKYITQSHPFSIEKLSCEAKGPNRPIMNQSFVKRDVFEAYACVYNEITNFDPILSPNGLFYIIPTNSAFYELCKQHQRILTHLLYTGECSDSNKSLEFSVRDNTEDVDEKTGQIRSVRMGKETYDAIYSYLKRTIFNHIQFVNFDTSVIEVRTNQIGFNNDFGSLFLTELRKLQLNQENYIEDTNKDFRKPSNVELSVQNTLFCMLRLRLSCYILYPDHIPPPGVTYMRRIDQSGSIRFPDPSTANRKESSNVQRDTGEGLIQDLFAEKKKSEELRAEQIQKAVKIHYTNVNPQNDQELKKVMKEATPLLSRGGGEGSSSDEVSVVDAKLGLSDIFSQTLAYQHTSHVVKVETTEVETIDAETTE